MTQQICFYDGQRIGRNLRRGMYRQEICRPLGFPVVQRKTLCCEPRIPTLVYPQCGKSYQRTPSDFLHHYDFKPACPKPRCPPCPPMSCVALPAPPSQSCAEPVCGPPMPVMCRDTVRCFPPGTAAETEVSGFRSAHSEPGLNIMSQGLTSTYRSPCDFINNFQVKHTMVSSCDPCAPRCESICKPAICPTTQLPVVNCCPGTGIATSQPIVIQELADECQTLGLCGYQKKPKYCYVTPGIQEIECRPTCCYEFKPPNCYQVAIPSAYQYTSIPGLEECIQPKPWRDPCGGRIYYRLTDYDLLQQW